MLRDYADPRNPVLTDEVFPGCEWVLDGEGTATRKLDGLCVLIRRDGLALHAYTRHVVKPGKATPQGFVLADEPDETTGNLLGWVPAEVSGRAKAINEALDG